MELPKNEQRCANCEHWTGHKVHSSQCKRFPPTVFMIDGRMVQKSPITDNDDCCGEWKDRVVDSGVDGKKCCTCGYALDVDGVCTNGACSCPKKYNQGIDGKMGFH